MFDVRRYFGIVAALVAIGAALGAERFALTPAFAYWRARRPTSDRYTDTSGIEAMGGRLAGASRSMRRQGDDRPLGLIFGSSLVECGLDAEVLDKLLPERRWLVLHSGGLNLLDLEVVDRLLLTPDAPKHDVVVVGLNEGMFADSPHWLDDKTSLDLTPFREAVREKHPWRAKQELETLIVSLLQNAFPERGRLDHGVRHLALQFRTEFLQSLSMKPDAIFAPHSEPFKLVRWIKNRFAGDSLVREQSKGWEEKGWFAAESYRLDGPNARALETVVRRIRQSGATPILVFMPEPKRSREALPERARIVCLEIARRALGPNDPGPIDCRSMIDDSQFYDLAHLNLFGLEEFTNRFAALVRDRLPRKENASRTPRKASTSK